jgi:hypothetical protein
MAQYHVPSSTSPFQFPGGGGGAWTSRSTAETAALEDECFSVRKFHVALSPCKLPSFLFIDLEPAAKEKNHK